MSDDNLEMLLTSEFGDIDKVDEAKNLIFQLRSHYRILHGRLSNQLIDFEFKKREFIEIKSQLESQIERLESEKKIIERDNIRLKSPRKLSLWERLKGKKDQE